MYVLIIHLEFQSTPPVKAATNSRISELMEALFQSTPPVKAATPRFFSPAALTGISIHAAREGGDGSRLTACCVRTEFQSTPPVKAATSIKSGDIITS